MSVSEPGTVVQNAPMAVDAPRWHRSRVLRALRPVLITGIALLITRMFGEYGNSIVVAACIAVIVVTGLHVLVHWAGQVSLGQVVFVAIGAFVTARFNVDFGAPLALAVLAGVGGSIVASAIVGLPALRVRGFALAIVTFALGLAAESWLYLQPWLLPSSTGEPLRATRLVSFSIADS